MYTYTKLAKWSDIRTEQQFLPVRCPVCAKLMGHLMADVNLPLPAIPVIFCSEDCVNKIFSRSREVTFYSVRQDIAEKKTRRRS